MCVIICNNFLKGISYFIIFPYFLDWKDQFWKLKKHEYLWLEFPFDYNSIMLYDEYAASKNGWKTHEAINGKKINRKTNLSEIDKEKLRNL